MKYLMALLCALFLSIPVAAQEHTSIGIVPPPLQPGTPRFDPPMIYKKWWKEIEHCAKLPIPEEREDAVQWRYVPEDVFVVAGDDRPLLGLTVSWHHTIFIVFGGIVTERLIKHEMLHYLLFNYGVMEVHPPVFQKCGVESK